MRYANALMPNEVETITRDAFTLAASKDFMGVRKGSLSAWIEC